MSRTSRFERFYETWLEQLHHLTCQLSRTQTDPQVTCQRVDSVLAHFSEFYRVKSLASESDVLLFFSAPWASSLERSLHWVTGFRPTTVLHLVYTESCARFDDADVLRSLRKGAIGEMSSGGGLARVNSLQCETVRAENEISERLGEWQEELVGVDWPAFGCGGGGEGLEGRIGRLRAVVAAADELRIETLRKVVEVLSVQQAADVLVAAAELLFGVRSWGLHQDCPRGTAV